MTEIAQQQDWGQLQQNLFQHFAEAASSVLSQITGVLLQAQTTPLAAASEAATLLRIEMTGSLQGLCEICLTTPMSAHFAALLTGETPETANEISSDTREAAAELIQQICGNAADRLRRAFGPLELKPHLAERDPGTGTRQLCVIARENGALEFEVNILRLALPPEFAAELHAATQCASQNSQQSAGTGAGEAATSQSTNRNLDLLLDIELGVTLRFGTRQMLLKDIIELCSGSVVELDRRVEEPVELLIDGRLIAQGEVVVVEGNYGLRVTQVATQGDKLSCLP
ncbi:MAG: flagellar motor switch protein FliN [Candidatus Korobacteraceae bacterium]|jgi:flagellar motor switch protein FliN/FliY